MIDATNANVATFVETSGLLAADTYTLTATTALKSVSGVALSANYTKAITVTAPSTPVVTIPSFAACENTGEPG